MLLEQNYQVLFIEVICNCLQSKFFTLKKFEEVMQHYLSIAKKVTNASAEFIVTGTCSKCIFKNYCV